LWGGGGGGGYSPYTPSGLTPTYTSPGYQPGGYGYQNYALGGRVPDNGRPIVVGEQGPEIFVPNQPGYVVPNHALSGPVGTAAPLSVDDMIAEIKGMFI